MVSLMPPPQQARSNEPETVQFRQFQGVNQVDARQAIDDKEFAWLENFIPHGNGNLELTPAQTASVATLPATVATVWGFVLNGTPLLFTIHTDGSMRQVTTGGVVTVAASAGVLTSAARLSLWQDSAVLIGDPTKGYLKWDGTTFSTIDASKTCTDLAVFEGRVWLVTGRRAITFTAPASNSDFTVGNGAGTFTISDAAFTGSIVRLLSAVEQLWVVGGGAVDAISNVQTSGGVTTFSNVNIVTNVGSTFPSSVASFFRTFLFLTPYGVYAIVGATPQKLSDKLDNLFPHLVLGTDQPSAVGTVDNIFVWCVLVTYADPALGNRPLLLCFAQGKWFFASPNLATTGLTWITSLLVNGTPQLWGTDGTRLFQLFATHALPVTYLLKTKLWDFGDSSERKQGNRVGLEFQSDNLVQTTVTVENENAARNQTITAFPQNTITFTGLAGAALTFTGLGGVPLVWLASGIVLARSQVQILGDYLGLTLAGTSMNFTLSAILWQISRGGKWN
jgi:hypothetical protein